MVNRPDRPHRAGVSRRIAAGLVLLILITAIVPLAPIQATVKSATLLFSAGSELGIWTTRSMVAGDMDADGDLDIVLGNERQANATYIESSQDVVYFNDGRGNFGESARALFGNGLDNTYAVAVGDLDNDGDLDIVSANYTGQNMVYFNSNATFAEGRAFGPLGSKTRALAVGDVDGDGDYDLVAGNDGQASVVYRNDGAGNFNWIGSVQPFGAPTTTTQAVGLADLDTDGDLDLVTGNYNQANVIYLNNGVGDFYAGALNCAALLANVRCFGSAGNKTRSLSIGDINDDNQLDIAVANENQINAVYINDGLSNFAYGTATAIDCNLGIIRCVGPSNSVGNDLNTAIVLADINTDGTLDVVVGNNYEANNQYEQNTVYFNNGAGTFYRNAGIVPCGAPPANVRCFGSGSDFTQTLLVADLDADGDLDIPIGNNNRGQPNLVYEHNGGGDFVAGTPIGVTSEPRVEEVALGDLDADSDLDVVMGRIGRQNLLYLNGGNGSFSTNSTGLPDCANPPLGMRCFGTGTDRTQTTAIGDVDGDHDLDIVAGNQQPFAVGDPVQADMIFLNDGAGNFYHGPVNCAAPPANVRCFGVDNDHTFQVVLGDVDGDSDLDIATAVWGQSVVYLNNGNGGFVHGALNCANPLLRCIGVGPETSIEHSGKVALGDMDTDGDLDVLLGSSGLNYRNAVFFNNASQFYHGPVTCPSANPAYRCFGTMNDDTRGLDVGDMDADGALDIITGNALQPNLVYFNDGRGGFARSRHFGTGADDTSDVVAADYDGDGDLDIVTVNSDQKSAISLNDGAGNFPVERTFGLGTDADESRSAAVGDLNADGDVDIVTGNFEIQGLVHRNRQIGGALLPNALPRVVVTRPGLTANAPSFSTPVIIADSVIPISYTLLDIDNDPVRSVSATFSLDGGATWRTAVPTTDTITTNLTTLGKIVEFDGVNDYINLVNPVSLGFTNTISLEAWVNPQTLAGHRNIISHGYTISPSSEVVLRIRDGQYEVGAWNGTEYFATAPVPSTDLNRWVHLAGTYDGTTWRLYRNGIEIAATVAPIGAIPVVAPWTIGGRSVAPLRSFQGPIRDVRLWNVARSAAEIQASMNTLPISDNLGLAGHWRLDEVRGNIAYDATPNANHGLLMNGLRHKAVPSAYVFNWDTFKSGFFGASDNVIFRMLAYPALKPQPYAVPTMTQRPYQRAQTTPFRVRATQIKITNNGVAAPNALVYRLPAEAVIGGEPLASGGAPFRTDERGFLRGRGQINVGDRLLALVPISQTATYTLYYTNGTPTPVGLDTFVVSESGVQTIDVSAAHPLILFDLWVALEWDATATPAYLDQLRFDLRRASQYLYDFSDGQVALGQVRVAQSAEEWAYANVVVHSSNRLRPYAAQGGIVLTDTLDPQHADIVYSSGQVHMGATWNRYGTPGQRISDDWPIILAHELSHYTLFLDDVYLGIDQNGFLKAIKGCTGSAMGDVYSDPTATEFIADDAFWAANCAETLPEQTSGRDEWETIDLWYPALHEPTVINAGPSLLPFDFTTVEVFEPITPTATLEDPTFYLNYASGTVSSNEGRAFLIRDDNYVIEMGSPVGGQNKVEARGAHVGDRLCVFDRALAHYGCEVIALGDDQIALKRDPTWTPVMQLTPVNSTTFGLRVEGLPSGLTLGTRLFPEFGAGTAAIAVPSVGGVYSGTFKLLDPTLAGNVQLWVDEPASETNPRREAMISYSIGGNLGNSRISGGNSRISGAPLVSPDGQMIFFTSNPTIFEEGQFYTVQGMAGLPPLPPNKKVIGQGYNLVASPGTPIITGSISFQYLSNETLIANVDEQSLRIHFWDGAGWAALPTEREPYFNFASAQSRGPGVYALMGGTTTPAITSINPHATTNATTRTLTINGGYFLPTVAVTLTAGDVHYSLPISAVTSTTITAIITAGLQPDEYTIQVQNGDGGVSAPQAFALYAPDSAVFYDFFASGSSQWQRGDAWDIVELPNGERVMTDSPNANYNSAVPPATRHTSSITSTAINLSGLATPQLTFRHDYVLANIGSSRDEARVEISTDNGATWTTLASYSGGGIYGPARPQPSAEWANATWKNASINLAGYTGTVHVRFTLDADQTAADKGWVLDDVRVASGTFTTYRVLLPLVVR